MLPLAMAAGLGAASIGAWFLTPSAPRMQAPVRMQANVPALPAAPRTGSIPLADAARVMERQLAAAGLDKQIKVTQRDNVLIAEGSLALDAHPKWRAIKAAVRDSVSDRLLIADTVKPIDGNDNALRNMIAAVGGGKSPVVIATNGKRAGIGEMFHDGWIVRTITADAIQLERGTSRITVKLTP